MAIPPTSEKPIRPARYQRWLALITGFSGTELADVASGIKLDPSLHTPVLQVYASTSHLTRALIGTEPAPPTGTRPYRHICAPCRPPILPDMGCLQSGPVYQISATVPATQLVGFQDLRSTRSARGNDFGEDPRGMGSQSQAVSSASSPGSIRPDSNSAPSRVAPVMSHRFVSTPRKSVSVRSVSTKRVPERRTKS